VRQRVFALARPRAKPGISGGVGRRTGAPSASGSLGPYRRLRECIPTPGGPLLISEAAGVFQPPVIGEGGGCS
jgi:hypothetical protein